MRDDRQHADSWHATVASVANARPARVDDRPAGHYLGERLQAWNGRQRTIANRPSIGWIAAFAWIVAACAPRRSADSEARPAVDPSRADSVVKAASRGRFYRGLSYGTEAQFNPLSEIVVEGFDIFRLAPDRHIARPNYGAKARHVLFALGHPFDTYRTYGVGRALRNEFLPLPAARDDGGGSWIPNYEFHLIGSGMVSMRMEEWYRYHDIPHPRAFAAATVMAAHFLNEVMEDQLVSKYNEDAVTDLLFFDVAGIFLFRSERVQRFFSERLELTNWPQQPTIVFPERTLETSGQQFALRGPLPWTTSNRFLIAFGLSTLGGISHDIGNGRSVSLAFGADVVDNPVVNVETGARTVSLKPNAGVFYDRNGSLLVSVLRTSLSDAAAIVNVYPGVVRVGGVSPGLWVEFLRRGGARVGLATNLGLGVGYGRSR